jgi:thiamine-phosphate pyrophosphorylase
MNFPLPRLYAIINAPGTGGSPAAVGQKLLDAGVRLIQLRFKTATTRELYIAGLELARLVRRAGGTFIINDRADVALAAEAGGVHLGQDDLLVAMARPLLGSGKIVGVSTHSIEQVREADGTSADYIAFGPIFSTRTKERPDPVVGLDGLREARRETAKPLVAIGGITLETAPEALGAGADSVAVIGDLLSGGDIGQRAAQFLSVLAGAAGQPNSEV